MVAARVVRLNGNFIEPIGVIGMYTRFASLEGFITAVQTETRSLAEIDDETLRWPIEEYRLWKIDTAPDRKPFAEDMRYRLDCQATRLYRSCSEPREPTAAGQHLFDLFGIDWRAGQIAEQSKSA